MFDFTRKYTNTNKNNSNKMIDYQYSNLAPGYGRLKMDDDWKANNSSKESQ